MKMIEHKKIISAVAVIAVVVIFTNFFIYVNGSKIRDKSQTQNLGVEQLEQHTAVGVVEKISGNEIFLKDVKKMPDNNNSANQTESIVVLVGEKTVIERFVQKDLASMKNELDSFIEKQKKLQGTATSTIPPEPFTRTKIALEDIKAGETIVVFSSADISKLTSFMAIGINVQPVASGVVPVR